MISADDEMKESEPSYTAGGMDDDAATEANSLAVLKEVKDRVTIMTQ